MDKPGATAWQEVSFTISRKLDLLFVLLSHEVSILTAKLGICLAALAQNASVTPLDILLLVRLPRTASLPCLLCTCTHVVGKAQTAAQLSCLHR